MWVKRTHYSKITDDDLSKISADIKNFVIKMKNEVKEKDKIINEYAKIINGKKKSTKICTQKIFSTGIT